MRLLARVYKVIIALASGRTHRIMMVERLIQHTMTKPGVWPRAR